MNTRFIGFAPIIWQLKRKNVTAKWKIYNFLKIKSEIFPFQVSDISNEPDINIILNEFKDSLDIIWQLKWKNVSAKWKNYNFVKIKSEIFPFQVSDTPNGKDKNYNLTVEMEYLTREMEWFLFCKNLVGSYSIWAVRQFKWTRYELQNWLIIFYNLTVEMEYLTNEMEWFSFYKNLVGSYYNLTVEMEYLTREMEWFSFCKNLVGSYSIWAVRQFKWTR